MAFSQSPTIAAAEYYINSDPGNGNGIPLIASDGIFDEGEEIFSASFSVSGLSGGQHTVYVRSKDSEGNWSPERGYSFMVNEGDSLTIIAAEYYIDNDPGEGNGIPIQPVDGSFDGAHESLEFSVNAAGLSIGRHYVYTRIQASNGKWGPARGYAINVENLVVISGAEFFFDTDPGEGNGTAIPAPKDGSFDSAFEEIEESVDLSGFGLSVGVHTMYMRFRNSIGEWSTSAVKEITIQTRPSIEISTDTLEFTEIVVGDSLTQTFTVSNSGDGKLNITNITSSIADYSVDVTTGSIPGNSSGELTFTVIYKPTVAGTRNGILTITNNDQSQTIQLLGSALAREPIIELSTTSVDFAETVLVGDSVALPFTVRNTGYDTLKVTSFSSSSGEFNVTPPSGILPPGRPLTDSLVFYVAMVPESEGDKSATITINSNTSAQQINVTGTAQLNPEPTISLVTDSLAFSAIEIGTESQKILQIRNLGTNTLHVSSFDLTGNGFSADITTPVNIVRGTPLDVPITFSPEASEIYSGRIEISSNDETNSVVEVVLSGEGTVGPPTRLISLNPDTLNFGQVTVGESVSQNFTIANDGNSTIKITGIASDETTFTVQDSPSESTPVFIAGGSSRDIEVGFSPSQGGGAVISGNIYISSDRTDSDEDVVLVMEGIGVDQPTPSVYLSTRRLDYGELRLDESKTLSFTLINKGNANLIVNNIEINNSDFSLTGSSATSFTLLPNDERMFDVLFAPNFITAYSSLLTIRSNTDPATVELIGEGVTLSAGIDTSAIRSEEVVVNSGNNIPIQLSPTGLGEDGAAFVYYKSGGGGSVSSYSKSKMKGNAGNFTFSIPSNFSSSDGVSYWFEVTDGVETVTSPETNPHQNPYSIIINLSDGIVRSSPQPAGSEQIYYRMISIPLDISSSSTSGVLENFGEADRNKWRLFRWQSGKYVEHTESNFEGFAPGRGYWFITSNAAALKTGEGKSIRTDQMFSMFLQPGWNMIGSPFTFEILWDNVIADDAVENLWSYDGSGFTNSTTLKPWEGYFIHNTSNNPAEIKLNPANGSTANSKRKGFLALTEEEGWYFNIKTSSGYINDDYNFLGVQNTAEDGRDDFDLQDAPKQPGEFLKLSLINEDDTDKKLSIDMRSPSIEGHFWDFVINTSTRKDKILIDFLPSGKLPEEFEAKLIDKNQETILDIDIRESTKREIRSGRGSEITREFRLIIGTDEYIKSKSLGISELPQEFVLKHNYPNPFNPSTTIVFGLPEKAKIKLEVYNAIGRKVSTLIDREMEAGYHDIIWDASGVASGVYFYRITAGGISAGSVFNKIRKMTLIK